MSTDRTPGEVSLSRRAALIVGAVALAGTGAGIGFLSDAGDDAGGTDATRASTDEDQDGNASTASVETNRTRNETETGTEPSP